MIQKHKRFRLRQRSVWILVIIVLVAISIAALCIYTYAHATSVKEPQDDAVVQSQFTFSGAPDWWQGATRATDMALFHRVQDGCFVSIQHKTGSIAADKAKIEKDMSNLTSSGYTRTQIGSQTLTLQTSDGPKQYELQQSSIITPAKANPVLGGQEQGYIQLHDSYIYIMGYCNTADELPATIPALQAIQFDSSK